MVSSKDNSGVQKKTLEIEGFRCLAILMVLSFHFFARWTQPFTIDNSYPYHFSFARNFTKYGYMGVQLFFMISGYVIMNSLENHPNIRSFVLSRIRRIYPSLFLAVPIIFVFCNLLNQKFIAPIPFSSLIPSITLLDPNFMNQIFGTRFVWTTGVLWSLFIEIQFYFVAGILFFNARRFSFVSKFFLLSLSVALIRLLMNIFFSGSKLFLDNIFPLNKYIWWFLAGSLFYQSQETKQGKKVGKYLILTLAFNALSLNFESMKFQANFFLSLNLLLFYSLFFLLCNRRNFLKIFRSKYLVILGGLSYEFYLIHESIGVSILSFINQSQIFSRFSFLLVPIFLILITFLIGFSLFLRNFSTRFTLALEMIYK
jgi:peptidoglycan/LPS O-acetylase OafA/YrhL